MAEKVISMKISDLKAGMKVGKTIINTVDGKVLIRKGEVLTYDALFELKNYFERNQNIKLSTINVEEAVFKIGEEEHYLPPKVSKYLERKAINLKTQQEALNVAEEVIKEARVGGNINSKAAEAAVSNVLNDILGNGDAALNLLNIKNFDDYTYTHSVNVATISVLVGTKLGLENESIIDLGVGALMHDLGKIRIPVDILNKSTKLTDEEFAVMKKHPVYTYEIMKGKEDISDIAKYVAVQHHEKFDGTGYPLGLKGKNINYYARIVALADVYDALTTDRVYRKAMLPYDAIKIIVSGSGTHFDAEMVRVFLKTFSIYPVGSYVKLNSGEIAVVKRIDAGNLIQPDVIIIKKATGELMEEPLELKLSEDKKRFISGAVVIDE